MIDQANTHAHNVRIRQHTTEPVSPRQSFDSALHPWGTIHKAALDFARADGVPFVVEDWIGRHWVPRCTIGPDGAVTYGAPA